MSEESPRKIVLQTVSFDARFPNTNQTKHCWQNYVDYNKCVAARGEDFEPCKQFFKAYQSLCPPQWLERWDAAKEAGASPHLPVAQSGHH